MADRHEKKDLAVIAAHQGLREAIARLESALRLALTPGREVSYEHGDHVRWVIVRSVDYHSARVENPDTGKSYRLDWRRIREITARG